MLKREYNIGLALLKIWMSFEVVLCHCYSVPENLEWYLLLFERIKTTAVPCFMLISFVLMENKLTSEGIILKYRIQRILTPYVFWTIFLFVLYNAIYIIFGVGVSFNIYSLFKQLFLGGGGKFASHFWYLFVLMLLTILFSVVKNSKSIIWIMFISFILQYTGINYAICNRFEVGVNNAIGRICEMLPYACLGILVSRSNILNGVKRTKTRKIYIIIFSIIAIILYCYTNLNKTLCGGFGYQGLNKICITFLVVVLFSVIDFQRYPVFISNTILFVSKFSFGVYCVHRFVGYVLYNIVFPLLEMNPYTFVGCIWVYITSFMISFCIYKLVNKQWQCLVT